MRSLQVLNVDPRQRYEGPEFDEYCISEGKYLPATRDRTPCVSCPLAKLCQAGFDEQVAKVQRGEDPSLTNGCVFDNDRLSPNQLLAGLSAEQIDFVTDKIPNLQIHGGNHE